MILEQVHDKIHFHLCSYFQVRNVLFLCLKMDCPCDFFVCWNPVRITDATRLMIGLHPNELSVSWKYLVKNVFNIPNPTEHHSLGSPTLNVLRIPAIAYSWAIILSFIIRVIASFSPEAVDTGGHFIDVIGYKNTGLKKMLATQYTVQCQLFTHMISWLIGSCKFCCHRPASRDSITSLGKDHHSQYSFYRMHIAFAPS